RLATRFPSCRASGHTRRNRNHGPAPRARSAHLLLLWHGRERVAMVPTIRIRKGRPMADHVVPHFHNDPGVPVIEIGAKEFMCIGALPPLDHPHVFLDMGGDNEIICPYCSTLYRHDPALDPRAARPAECAYEPAEA